MQLKGNHDDPETLSKQIKYQGAQLSELRQQADDKIARHRDDSKGDSSTGSLPLPRL